MAARAETVCGIDVGPLVSGRCASNLRGPSDERHLPLDEGPA